MHFCDSNHEVTRMRQEEKEEHQEQRLTACWWKYENVKNLRFSKL